MEQPGRPSDEHVRGIYATTRTIAVVGASANDDKPANRIPRYLQAQAYRILPINPKEDEILGERVYRSLRDIAVPVDVVDVFRPPAEAEQIAMDAVAIRPRVLWFQPGTHTGEAIRIATDAGLTVVAERCMGHTHRVLGLGPGPEG
jgi:predicted CoA-binding protein